MGREHGFLMIRYNTPDIIKELHKKIPVEELYTEDGSDDYGLEKCTHVTLVPCLDRHLDVDTIKKELMSLGKYAVLLHNISKFEGEKWDVLKCDVGNMNLLDTNKHICSKFPTFSEFKDYKPHMTIGYLKKGMADKYLKESILPWVVCHPSCFMWSGSNEDESDFDLEWS